MANIEISRPNGCVNEWIVSKGKSQVYVSNDGAGRFSLWSVRNGQMDRPIVNGFGEQLSVTGEGPALSIAIQYLGEELHGLIKLSSER